MAFSLINAGTFNGCTVPGTGVRRHVALVHVGVGDGAAGPVLLRDGDRGGGRAPGQPVVVANLSNFLGVLLVLFIPWSAISLAGYTPAQLMAGPAVPVARRSGRA